MDDFVIIFNTLMESYGYSKSQISRWSGLSRTMIIRFCSGENISTTYFFKLVRSMPIEFQEDFWSHVLSVEQAKEIELIRNPSWYTLIADASHKDIQEILQALANRWSVIVGDKNSDNTKELEAS